MTKIYVVSGLVVSVTLFAAPAAFAQAGQWRPERPNPGIYASGTSQSAQVLTVDGSVGSGYDTSAQLGASEAGLGAIGRPLASEGSVYNQFSGALSYSANLDKWSLGASLSSSGRQYPRLDVPLTMGHAASFGAGVTLGRRTSVHGNVATTFHSARSFIPFAPLGDPALGQIDSPNLDFAYGNTRYFTHSVDVGINQQLSRRGALTGSYSNYGNSYSTLYPNMTSWTGSIRYTRGLTRDLNLRLGYGYSDARYGVAGRQYQTHNLDTGVDYNHALSLSRRTRLAFTTGATAFQTTNATALPQEQQQQADALRCDRVRDADSRSRPDLERVSCLSARCGIRGIHTGADVFGFDHRRVRWAHQSPALVPFWSEHQSRHGRFPQWFKTMGLAR